MSIWEQFVGIRSIYSILLKNWEGIRVLGKVFVYFSIFSKCLNTFSNTFEYFGIL